MKKDKFYTSDPVNSIYAKVIIGFFAVALSFILIALAFFAVADNVSKNHSMAESKSDKLISKTSEINVAKFNVTDYDFESNAAIKNERNGLYQVFTSIDLQQEDFLNSNGSYVSGVFDDVDVIVGNNGKCYTAVFENNGEKTYSSSDFNFGEWSLDKPNTCA